MKKLIAMIGAVAMSFGLFADATPAPFVISYEANESAAGVSGGTWTPGSQWTWDGDPIPVITEQARVLPYDDSGSKARRDDVFLTVTGGTDNNNFANLSTGSDKLALAVESGNLYLDQLVKFTGFEDPQTNLVAGTKIAVWMSEFENDDESTTTNLYITCGKNVDGTYKQVALQIEGTYELNTWYRLTVKSLRDIFDGAPGSTPRAGFLVWVNGNQATCEEAKGLLGLDASMITDTKKAAFYNAGRLFPSIAAGATFTSVGYQGIGAIDDIIVDAEGPKFTVETVDVSFNPITGAVIAKVVDSDGTVFNYPTGTIAVKPGNLTVTLEADEGYKMKPGAGTYEVDASTEGTKDISVEEGDFVEVYATKVNGETTTEYGAAELLTMINNLVDRDVVTFNLASTITDTVEEEEVTLYSFTADSTITVSVENYVTNWAVVIAGESAWAEDYVGTDAAFIKNYTFEYENSSLGLYGGIDGSFTAPNVVVCDSILVSGTLKAAVLDASEGVTLSGAGKVITQVSNLKSIKDGEGNAVTPTAGVPEAGWYTYALSDVPPEKIEYVTFTVTYDTAKVENVTVKTNGADVVNVEGVYTVESNAVVTVAATAKTGYQNVTIAVDNVTVDAGVFKADKASSVITIAAFTLQPVDPETPKNYDSKEAADAAAAKINANKTAMIKTPDGADAADYTKLFTAVVKANNAVVVELNEGGTNALKTAADTIKTAVANKLGDIAAAAAGGNVEVVVTGVEPGFWYGVAATADLTTMGASQPTKWVQAKNGSVTIQATKPDTGNAAFFQTRVKVK